MSGENADPKRPVLRVISGSPSDEELAAILAIVASAAPEAEPAQPRALIGGHLVTALTGFAVLWLTGPQAWAAAFAVGLSILVMYLTGTFHPPAGINPLLVVSGNLPWTFILAPVLAGAVLVTAFAIVWHRWVRRQNWPRRWV